MEKKVNIITHFISLIITVVLLGCGVKGDPEEPKIKTIIFKDIEINN